MEILNNIWNALSTENEMITKVLSSPLSIIEVYLTFKLFTTILKTNYTKKQLFIYVFSVAILSIICNLFIHKEESVKVC